MPKKTFFHLTEEKQQRLLDAASVEFSRASLKTASIANIVKLAEIPRGSFYQYFEDKEDLYYYYFALLRQNSKKNIEKCIKEANGDLFIGMETYFSRVISDVLIGEHASFYKNLFMNMDDQLNNRISSHFIEKNRKGDKNQKKRHGYEIYQMIDFSTLNVSGEQEFKMLLQMLMNTLYSSITEGYRQLEENPESDIEQIIKNFEIKINWLKNGVYK